MTFLKNREIKKNATEVLRHARHVRNMREDIMDAADLDLLNKKEQRLRDLLKASDYQEVEKESELLAELLDRIAPKIGGGGGGLRENFEIIVVALAVAMALRTYFIQPFKIPTGSMQPTLYGITSVSKDKPGVTDRFPLKFVKFAITGQWYSERRAQADGTLGFPTQSPKDPSVVLFSISGKQHKIPRDAIDVYSRPGHYDLKVRPGGYVHKGDLLWSGIVTRGDHVFVNKLIWNFRKPKRGEIMVFYTTGINSLPQGTHYIKRMCGMPGESVSIDEPNLVINGKVVKQPDTIARIESCKNGYTGYQLAGNLSTPDKSWKLDDDEYFAMGDNTGNSRDSRYWGSVPAKNLVGPACVVYWPFSKRWGLAR